MAPTTVVLLLCVGLQTSVWARDLNMKDSEHVTGDVCQDCTQIFELAVDIISNENIQKQILANIETLCDLLPGPSTTVQICRQQIEKMLPLAITFFTAAVKPEKVCSYLGLCGSHLEDDQEERQMIRDLQESLRHAVKTLDLSQMTWTGEHNGPLDQSSQCTYCIVLLDALQKMFPKEKTEAAVVDLLLGGCGLIPSSYRDKCEALVDQFAKPLLDTLLSHVTSKTICSLLQLCSSEGEALDGQGLVEQCAERTFRCRDAKTALRCGTVSFCQRFAWRYPRNRLF